MRLLSASALVALVFLSAAGAAVDPGALVIQQTDVPVGFRLDPAETGLRTNALEAREVPQTRERFRRWRRVTGYQVKYRRASASIEARVDVFRAAEGADSLLDWVRSEARKAGIAGQKLDRSRIGTRGFVFSAGSSYTLVAWRQGPVFSGVFGEGIPRARVIELARAQQRRIVSALR